MGPGFRRDDVLGAAGVFIQITPCRIEFLNQLYLPATLLFLELLFARYGAFHGVVCFKPDMPLHVVLAREPRNAAVLVIPHPAAKIAGDANVKRAVPFACENVDCGLFLHHDNQTYLSAR
jgi:hypothetical protein